MFTSNCASLPFVTRSWPIIATACLLAGQGAIAQIRPDSGSLLDGLRDTSPLTPSSPRQLLELPAAPQVVGSGTATLRVQRVSFEGAHLITEQELQQLAAPLLDREVALEQIQALTAAITSWYAERGFFLSRALIPAQDLRTGVLRIRIVEAVYGATAFTGAERLSSASVQGILTAQGVVAGAPVERAGLERSLLLLEDLPGIQTQARFAPGATVGSSDLSVGLKEGPMVTGKLGGDNLGGYYTGRQRISGQLQLNDPLGHGDLLRVAGLRSRGLDYVSAAYQRPVGYHGLRVGAHASTLSYDLCCSLAALNAKGKVSAWGLNASYPWQLSQQESLRSDWSLERRNSSDKAAGLEISNRRIDVSTLALNWLSADRWGGMFSVYGGATVGHLDLSGNAANAQFDAATAQTAGSYGKLRLAYARMQVVGRSQWLLRLNGQLASKNLDSSEKLSLGGMEGVRAYAQGEAAGDQGLLASVEYAYMLNLPLPGRVQASAFADAGRTQLNRHLWNGYQGTRQTLPNQYSLAGWGLGLRWDTPNGASAQLLLARQAGSNPGRQANGQDSDGQTGKNRVLLLLSLPL